jgi:GTPase SAR1 family protein
MDVVLDSISLGKTQSNKPLKDLCLSDDTRRKRESTIVNTQVLCFSESNDKYREYNNAVSVCQSFECLDDDNSLTYRKCKSKNLDILDTKIKGVEVLKVQTKEGQNFLSLPGRELLEEHKIIEHTNVLETEVPFKLQSGYISLGISTYKGNPKEAFHRDNYDQGNFPLVLIGEQGSGKTTYISNYVQSIQKRNEGCMVIDFIKNCELSEIIKKVTPKDKLIELDMSDIQNAQGIGYNELVPKSIKSLDVLDVANRKALYIQMLVDALNVDGDPLSSSMDRYLSAASNIVFLNNSASLKDVVKCLNDFRYRKLCIDSVPLELLDYLDEEISALLELDDRDKDGTISGTKMAKIDGVNHRINLLRKDLRLKMMFNKNCNDNIDLVKAMDEGKIILIKMPQEYFSTPYSKNVIVTYLFTKIWAATLIRGSRQAQPRRFHTIVDEIFQSKTSMKLLKEQETLPQTRKFGSKFVFSCQYLGQIELIDQTLRSAGASYMLMKGSGKANFNEFKDELYPYTLDDMESLPQYSSLNIINYEDGRAKFITKLPKPL